MTDEQRERITILQCQGKGYRTIAAEMNLPVNSVKSWCRRHTASKNTTGCCKQCGTVLQQTPGKRKGLFCSDYCRRQWWANHPESRGHRVEYQHSCRFCGKAFTNNRVKADYCGRPCFAKARMKATADE